MTASPQHTPAGGVLTGRDTEEHSCPARAIRLGTLYHGAKFAVEGLSESLAYELGTVGVRVKLVEPGGIRTDFGGRMLDARRTADDATFLAGIRDRFGLADVPAEAGR